MQEDVVRAAVSSRSADKLAAQEERPETRSPVSVSFFNDTSKMKEMIARWLMVKLTEARIMVNSISVKKKIQHLYGVV